MQSLCFAIVEKSSKGIDLPLRLFFSVSGLPCQLIAITGFCSLVRIDFHLLISESGTEIYGSSSDGTNYTSGLSNYYPNCMGRYNGVVNYNIAVFVR